MSVGENVQPSAATTINKETTGYRNLLLPFLVRCNRSMQLRMIRSKNHLLFLKYTYPACERD
jgi:hypothetical protein